MTAPYIVCPRCGFVSHNPNDVRERYCVQCHWFHDDPPPSEPHTVTEGGTPEDAEYWAKRNALKPGAKE